MHDTSALARTFREKAELVSAVVTEISGMDEALAYVVEACDKKDACQLLISGCEAPLSAPAQELCETKQAKVIAAPALDDATYAKLEALCRKKGFVLVKGGLRGRLAGIDIGFGVVDYGLAETGTLVLDSSDEEMRLSTMICETHVAVLPLSKLLPGSYDLEPILDGWLKAPSRYASFITGASRTADIERVLAIGVHGPLELHILLLDDVKGA